VAVLHRSLVRHGFNAVALHGDMDQPARMAALDQFRRGEVSLLIASDVAARGLDIPDVSHIFNFDVPHHADDYVHRIGRTGRAGKSGTAITLVTPADRKAVDAIEKLIGRTIEWAKAPPRSERPEREPQPRPHAPRRQERPSGPVKTAQIARIDDARPHRRQGQGGRERGADISSHLPAFLLRPARVKA
jgi:superfamily II DNA/RNA helicase